MQHQHCEPAASLISRLGGLSAVAQITGKSITQVQRWRMPKGKGGTGGSVPRWHAQALFAAAKERGIELTPSDLFAMEPAE